MIGLKLPLVGRVESLAVGEGSLFSSHRTQPGLSPRTSGGFSGIELPGPRLRWILTHLPCSLRSAQSSSVDFLSAGSTTWDNLPVVLTGVWVSVTRWNLAAASDLPPMCSKFNFFVCRRTEAIARCFVMRSAVSSSPGIFVKGNISRIALATIDS